MVSVGLRAPLVPKTEPPKLGDYLKGENQTFLDGLAALDAYARAN